MPTLLVVGMLDHPDVQHRIEVLDEEISDTRVFRVKSSGHTPTLEAPDTLAGGIREFLVALNWGSPEECREAAPTVAR